MFVNFVSCISISGAQFSRSPRDDVSQLFSSATDTEVGIDCPDHTHTPPARHRRKPTFCNGACMHQMKPMHILSHNHASIGHLLPIDICSEMHLISSAER